MIILGLEPVKSFFGSPLSIHMDYTVVCSVMLSLSNLHLFGARCYLPTVVGGVLCGRSKLRDGTITPTD